MAPPLHALCLRGALQLRRGGAGCRFWREASTVRPDGDKNAAANPAGLAGREAEEREDGPLAAAVETVAGTGEMAKDAVEGAWEVAKGTGEVVKETVKAAATPGGVEEPKEFVEPPPPPPPRN